MPMELSYSSLVEMLLCSGDVRTRREIRDHLFTSPPFIENSSFGVTEAPFQVWHDSIVGRLLCEIIGVGQINLMIRTT